MGRNIDMAAIRRSAHAVWQGGGKDGKGTVSAQSGTLHETPYSATARFGDGKGTNPEELIAAAHAGCFSMALSNILGKAGITPNSIETTATIHLDLPAGITKIELATVGDVPGLDEADFVKYADEAKANCPVSKALAAVEITLSAKLA
jgi:osmotically inducible protein OsmC